MTAAPVVVAVYDSIARAAVLMDELDVGMLPVVEGYDTMIAVGVITDRDIVTRHVAHLHSTECLVRDHMTAAPLSVVRPEDHVHDAIGRMKHDRIRRILVVDGDHKLVGVITQADIARRLGPAEPKLVEELLEEVSAPAHPGRS
jgi:signal-transduction protein with cAMP-binding, CBS, and nucleotidyltransferase domain